MNEQTKKPAGTQTPNRPTQGDQNLEKGQQEKRRDEELDTDLDKKQDQDTDLENR